MRSRAIATIDRVNDRVRPGAFARTIERWRASGKQLPLHYDHKGDPEYIIGSVNPDAMAELDEGLYVEGRLDLEDSAMAREAWRSMKANRVGLSFAYMVGAEEKAGDGVNDLLELDVYEISITPQPCNTDTRILSMKSVRPSVEELRQRCRELGIDVPDGRGHKAPEPARKAAYVRIASFEC